VLLRMFKNVGVPVIVYVTGWKALA
jgi:hypothetical protein